MKKYKWWIVAGIVLVLLSGAGFYVANLAENKIKTELDKAQVGYSDIHVRLFPSNVEIKEVKYQKEQKTGFAKSLKVSGVSYWDYLINKNINIDKIIVSEPTWEQKSSDNESNEKNNTPDSLPQITVKKFQIEEANVLMTNGQDTVLNLNNGNLNLQDISLNNNTMKRKIPLEWEEASFTFEKLFSHIDKIHSLSIESFAFDTTNFTIQNLEINPRYSRAGYVYHIPHEKDLATLKISEISGKEFHLKNRKDTLAFNLNMLDVKKPNLNLYRDKTVKDDPTHKNLYSKMLRIAPILIRVDSIIINNGYVSYEEKHKEEQGAGKVTFANFEANIGKLYNHDPSGEIPDTKINMKALVFDESPVDVDWTFNIGSPQDYFNIQGNGHNFNATSINNFLTPAFLIETEGIVDKFYFNYSGNYEKAAGDFQIYYDNFKVNLLNKDRKEKKILSWIGNLFVKNKPKSDGNGETHVEDVKRDDTKSFWNYFWNCIQESLVQSLTVKSDDKKD
ncbi:hypothetical protein C7377_0610 [Balneicella halophila]|uniref:DUF748 domain-containing protein n=1 Tax=Balneicella halophila TaxID=1537566 RepID=A0A7L4UR97_BALHA|nr:hypothetical protein [Balneicella halophila]PVX52298.1 hypothetical protein C7377_0610 [Balneicella halophila]